MFAEYTISGATVQEYKSEHEETELPNYNLPLYSRINDSFKEINISINNYRPNQKEMVKTIDMFHSLNNSASTQDTDKFDTESMHIEPHALPMEKFILDTTTETKSVRDEEIYLEDQSDTIPSSSPCRSQPMTPTSSGYKIQPINKIPNEAKKNVGGLIRERALKGLFEIFNGEITGRETQADLRLQFQGLNREQKIRLRYLQDLFEDLTSDLFSDFMTFIVNYKGNYKAWKDKKTWKQLCELCRVRGYENGGYVLSELLRRFISQEGKSDFYDWMGKFKGKDEVKAYLKSPILLEDFCRHVYDNLHEK
jgi:hypothetical protein